MRAVSWGHSGGLILMMGFAVSAGGCAEGEAERAEAPVARVDSTELVTHGQTRIDEYYWLREREDPEVVAYLEAENEYLADGMAHTDELQETLFQEIVGRIKEDDQSVPYRFRDYYYQARFEEGKEYPIHERRPGAIDAPAEVMVDVNQLAEGHDYFSASVGVRGISAGVGFGRAGRPPPRRDVGQARGNGTRPRDRGSGATWVLAPLQKSTGWVPAT